MAEVLPQEYVLVPTEQLEPHPDNPHRGDVGLIGESIERNGWYGATLVQRSRMRIIAGEHRWRAAQAKGLAMTPALLLDVDDDQALRIMLADNRISDYGHYDDPALAALLASLPDLAGTGWTPDDLADLDAALPAWVEVVGQERPERAEPPAAVRAPEEEAGAARGPHPSASSAAEAAAPGPAAPLTPASASSGRAELLVVFAPEEHAEAIALIRAIRDRDGETSVGRIVLAALRAHAT
ncbi:ParB/RepB/Spo0J family partition protein [Bailinhaonella thermotolerans]|uniref:ParB/RepB/Spo0J family partition protein n=1 Tax=Bailinhaonella thermotolerans TaxID=1070861 RepID=UPI0011C47686|nr:ParB/RepB/Spo0J family partition protein [Bailinhaonella thermotolerans]